MRSGSDELLDPGLPWFICSSWRELWLGAVTGVWPAARAGVSGCAGSSGGSVTRSLGGSLWMCRERGHECDQELSWESLDVLGAVMGVWPGARAGVSGCAGSCDRNVTRSSGGSLWMCWELWQECDQELGRESLDVPGAVTGVWPGARAGVSGCAGSCDGSVTRSSGRSETRSSGGSLWMCWEHRRSVCEAGE